MGLREDLQKKIDKKKQEISDLEAMVMRETSYLAALQDMLKMLPREGANVGLAGQILRPGSGLAKARDAILKAGRPLHVNEILAAIGKPANKENRSGLNGSIGAYFRRGEIFTRPAPNTYGLIELGHGAEADADIEIESPPAGFGKDEE